MIAQVTYRNVFSQVIDIWEGELAGAFSNIHTKNVCATLKPMSTTVIVNQKDFVPMEG